MNLFLLEAILLFAFSIPVVMGYRILPVTGTPHWLFGVLFLLLITNIFLALKRATGKWQTFIVQAREHIVWFILIIVVGGTTVTAIVDRSQTAPVFGVHDIILQQEAAMRFLLSGKNPYKETYFGTPLASWHYDESGKTAINPALYHFVMPPWYLLFPLPIYAVSIPIVGYFDGRMALLVTLAGLLFVLSKWFKKRPIALLAITLTALSPATINYFIEGRSDIFALFWFIWSLYLLEKKQLFWSSVIFGLALMSKQTIWFAVPFYLALLWVERKKDIPSTFLYGGIAAIVSLLVAGPFLLWDFRAFFDSTVWYLSGNTAHGYPISGYGLGMMLYELHAISDIHAYYPFIIWQILFGLPIFIISLKWFLQKPTIWKMIIGYSLSLSVFWYMSRYFNNSHLGFLSSIFAIGALKYMDEEPA